MPKCNPSDDLEILERVLVHQRRVRRFLVVSIGAWLGFEAGLGYLNWRAHRWGTLAVDAGIVAVLLPVALAAMRRGDRMWRETERLVRVGKHLRQMLRWREN